MKSLRGMVLIGAALWTIGLLAVWAVTITLNRDALHSVALVHAYPHSLGVLAILSMLAGFAMVRAGLKPLNEMRRRLADVQSGSAKQVQGHYPAEVQPLVNDLNALLAHQAHARAAASGATLGARCDVRLSAEGLARTLQRLHADRGIAIDIDVPADRAVRCQCEDLEEMLGNLLDNACKWARARVVLSMAAFAAAPDTAGDRVALVVDDDGPGLAPSMREAVLQRGVRADEAAPGSGFGLAIVREIADVYGGAIVLEDSPLGGLRARLLLPAVTPGGPR